MNEIFINANTNVIYCSGAGKNAWDLGNLSI